MEKKMEAIGIIKGLRRDLWGYVGVILGYI